MQLKYDKLLIRLICPSCQNQWQVMGSEGVHKKVPKSTINKAVQDPTDRPPAMQSKPVEPFHQEPMRIKRKDRLLIKKEAPTWKKGTDLTGKTFGELTVKELSNFDGGDKEIWRCKCSCGTQWHGSELEIRNNGCCTSCRIGGRVAKKRSQGVKREIEASPTPTKIRRKTPAPLKGDRHQNPRESEIENELWVAVVLVIISVAFDSIILLVWFGMAFYVWWPHRHTPGGGRDHQPGPYGFLFQLLMGGWALPHFWVRGRYTGTIIIALVIMSRIAEKWA